MRTFIAIELSQEIKDFLSNIQSQLKASGADVKWVEPKNIHLTLKFLGEIDEKKLVEVNKVLEETARNKNPFSLRFSCLGAYPKINFPRVIWIGIDQGDIEVKEIAGILEERVAKLGIPQENRPFSCHITLGRTKSNLKQEDLVKKLTFLEGNLGGKKPEFQVTKLTLFKSTLTPKGPLYEVLKEAHLKAT